MQRNCSQSLLFLFYKELMSSLSYQLFDYSFINKIIKKRNEINLISCFNKETSSKALIYSRILNKHHSAFSKSVEKRLIYDIIVKNYKHSPVLVYDLCFKFLKILLYYVNEYQYFKRFRNVHDMFLHYRSRLLFKS